MTEPIFLIVDLFCGAGGTTTGFAMAELEGNKIAKVIACVNHDHKAIISHWKNHPEVKHFEEDIRTLDLTELIEVVKFQRALYPNAKLILWASLECTNFSKAKGGQPRDADSRTLADHLERYILALNPDYVQIENVVEFMSWGPLDDNGKPVSRKNGSDWMRWRKEICAMGYIDEWKELNSANFGAYTSRNRLFGCFAKDDNVICWPEPTHAKVPSKQSMHGDLKKWMPVKDVLNFSDEGESIFTRKKPLSDKTLERIYAGLIKYIAKGDTSFISKYYSGKPASKNISVDGPAGTIKTVDGQALVQPICLLKYDSTDKTGKHYPPSLENPCPVVIAQGRLGLIQGEFLVDMQWSTRNGTPAKSVEDPCNTLLASASPPYLVQPEFITNYYNNGFNSSVNDPCPTLRTKAGQAFVQPKFFIDKHYGAAQNQSINEPAGTILPTDKHRLVEAVPFIMPTNYDNGPKSVEEPLQTITANRKHSYIINPSHGGHSTSIDAPCPVIIARQDKAPLYFVQVETGSIAIAVFDNDSDICIKIKQFMAVYGLVDIKMRMLRVLELLKIQGFPDEYKLEGNQSDQKKFIGNSVHPLVVKYWAEAMATKIIFINSKKKVA
jgi:DNA (cytosine-5)-methyltransferase 1